MLDDRKLELLLMMAREVEDLERSLYASPLHSSPDQAVEQSPASTALPRPLPALKSRPRTSRFTLRAAPLTWAAAWGGVALAAAALVLLTLGLGVWSHSLAPAPRPGPDLALRSPQTADNASPQTPLTPPFAHAPNVHTHGANPQSEPELRALLAAGQLPWPFNGEVAMSGPLWVGSPYFQSPEPRSGLVLTIIEDEGGRVECVRWAEYDWGQGRSITEVKPAELVNLSLMLSCDTRPGRIVVVGLQGPRDALPVGDALASEFARCVLRAPARCSALTCCNPGAAIECLPDDVTMKLEQVALR